ncbi:hypothetical protein RHSIM_Rhsim09G0076800 [Rhododendron simsii]|uniref:Uncharacterized protein n=1 Tax=Rhododendron simsii TaxID=118357 RepID=A0A834GGN9_RHOSS|nr:hypothetical protein RHSIM_Rhsim09G0076800 [Rhododendron simsii]
MRFACEGFGSDWYSNFLVWDTPSFVTLHDLIASNSSEHSLQAMGVPPLLKALVYLSYYWLHAKFLFVARVENGRGRFYWKPSGKRTSARGQYKEEILSQLRETANSELGFSDCKGDIEPFMQFQSLLPEQDLQPRDRYDGFDRGSELATVPSL